MTPRQLDWESIRAKLRMMQSLLGDLAGLGEFDQARLETDRVPTLAAERILTLVAEEPG